MAHSLETESPEYLAVKGHIAAINRRVPNADLPSFSSELLQAGLITDAIHTDAIAATGLGPGHKIASLTVATMEAIKTTPNLFGRFVNILEVIDKEIASILRKKCLEHTCRRRRRNVESCGEAETASCSVLNSTPAGMY